MSTAGPVVHFLDGLLFGARCAGARSGAPLLFSLGKRECPRACARAGFFSFERRWAFSSKTTRTQVHAAARDGRVAVAVRGALLCLPDPLPHDRDLRVARALESGLPPGARRAATAHVVVRGLVAELLGQGALRRPAAGAPGRAQEGFSSHTHTNSVCLENNTAGSERRVSVQSTRARLLLSPERETSLSRYVSDSNAIAITL